MCKNLPYDPTETFRQDNVLEFKIGDGRSISATMLQEIDQLNEQLLFRSIMIHLNEGDSSHLLATVEYEPHSFKENGANTIRTQVYTYDDDDPIHTSYPLKRRVAWVSHSNNRYQVNVCDIENNNARVNALEVDHLESELEANTVIAKMISENPQYLWTRLRQAALTTQTSVDVKVQLGGKYNDHQYEYRVLALSFGVGLLEAKQHDEVYQYIVAKTLYLDDDKNLCWEGDAITPDAIRDNANMQALKDAWRAFYSEIERATNS